MKVAGYARVSTTDQAVLGMGLEHQKEEIQKYCEERGYNLLQQDHYYVDRGYSGSDFDSRPGLSQLRLAAEQGHFEAVVVYRIDRLGRRGAKLLHLICEEFSASGVRTLVVDRDLDSFKKSDHRVIFNDSLTAQELREEILLKTNAAKRLRAKQGRWTGGLPPIGYELDRDTHSLVECVKESKIVRLVWRKFLEGMGIKAIAAYLNDRGIEPARATVPLPKPRRCVIAGREKRSDSCYLRPAHSDYTTYCIPCLKKHDAINKITRPNGWGKSTVSKILKNELYVGTMLYARNTPERTDGLDLPRSIVRADASTHPALVTKDENIVAQETLKARRTRPPRMGTGSYFLSGVILCECGAHMTGRDDKKGWRAYQCNARRDKGHSVCDSASLNVKVIEPYVLSEIESFLSRVDDRSYFKTEAWQRYGQRNEELQRRIGMLQRQRGDAQVRRKRLLKAIESGVPIEELMDRASEIEAEVRQVDESIQLAEASLRNDADFGSRKEKLLSLSQNFRANWEVASHAERNKLVQCLVDSVLVSKTGTIEVVFNF